MPSTWSSLTTAYKEGELSYKFKHTAVVPMSREGAIVFPTNKTTGKIDYSMYQPTMTKGVIPIDEIANFLQGIEAFVQPIFKSNLEALQSRLWTIFLVVLVVVVIFTGADIGGLLNTGLSESAISVIALLIIVILGVGLFVYNHVAVTDVRKKIQASKEKILVYLQQYNGPFQAAGYMWVAPENFPYWIELCTATPDQGMSVGIVQPMGGLNIQQPYMMLPQQQTPGYGESHFNSPLQIYSLA